MVDQDDVLRKKQGVTSGTRGLQQWGDEGVPEGGTGTAGSGTAQRAARITRGQRREKD